MSPLMPPAGVKTNVRSSIFWRINSRIIAMDDLSFIPEVTTRLPLLIFAAASERESTFGIAETSYLNHRGFNASAL